MFDAVKQMRAEKMGALYTYNVPVKIVSAVNPPTMNAVNWLLFIELEICVTGCDQIFVTEIYAISHNDVYIYPVDLSLYVLLIVLYSSFSKLFYHSLTVSFTICWITPVLAPMHACSCEMDIACRSVQDWVLDNHWHQYWTFAFSHYIFGDTVNT